MEIEIFNTWEETWNKIPDMELEDIIRLGSSKKWYYYVWFRGVTTTSIIRVKRNM